MNFSIDSHGTGIVTLQGDLTIERAKTLQEFFVQSLQDPMDVVIRLSDITNLDVACMQVLYTAKNRIENSGHQATIEAEETDIAFRIMESSGFTREIMG